ncbi:MAG: hypothetical protein EOP86_16050 [Verrucomicrobiaceae bacterium]|nr:MAG: hypothetical protein EOP86_16050 [Verrucomicrobiaceae bacterium]
MIIGDPSTFAIESGATCAYERLSFRALGYFQIHIRGRCFGVRAPDASMLACSLGEVEDRIARRGLHIAPFATESGGDIADAIGVANYAPEEEGKKLFGMSQAELSTYFHSQHLIWAPDGDEAFDDGSFVLQFDVGDRVRLIGFRSGDDYLHNPATLADLWLDASAFYEILDQWRSSFLAEWQAAKKVSEKEDQKAQQGEAGL